MTSHEKTFIGWSHRLLIPRHTVFIDTHTHIYTKEFDADREEVIERAQKTGAKALLLPNIDEYSIDPMLQVCRKYPSLCYPMMGLHPTELPTDPWPVIERMTQRLQAPNNPYIAIGEVGIDLYWDDSRCNEQVEVFRAQALLAERFSLPLVVHCRAAHSYLVETLRPLKNTLTGVFHCFSGTTEEAAELLHTFPHFMLGIGGTLTFKKSTLPAVLHSEVPLSRIVVETDAPYLAPTPHRGKRNEPAFVPLVIEKLSDIYELPVENVEQTLINNTLQVFQHTSM